MNILYVYEYYTPHIGGGEIAVQALAEQVAADGHTVQLITTRLANTQKAEVLNGVTIYRVSVPRFGQRYWFMLFSIPAIWKRAKTAEVIHTFTYTAVPSAWLVAKLLRKKIILTIHEFWGGKWFNFSGQHTLSALLHQWFERFLYVLPMDAWVAISEATKSDLAPLKLPTHKLSVIYQGIDQTLFQTPTPETTQKLRQSLEVTENTFVYLFFGRPGISKGLEFLLQAVPEITRQVPNSQLWLLLAHEPAAQYQKMLSLIQQLKIEKQVKLIDPVRRAELPSYLGAAQVVVIPSLSEGFGFSVAEACAVGTPVIASRIGSIPEVISGAYELVEPGSSAGITQAVVKAEQGKIETRAKKLFSWEITTQAYEKLYQKLQNAKKLD